MSSTRLLLAFALCFVIVRLYESDRSLQVLERHYFMKIERTERPESPIRDFLSSINAPPKPSDRISLTLKPFPRPISPSFSPTEKSTSKPTASKTFTPTPKAKTKTKKPITTKEAIIPNSRSSSFSDTIACTVAQTRQHCQSPCFAFRNCTFDCDTTELTDRIPQKCHYRSWGQSTSQQQQQPQPQQKNQQHHRLIWVGDSITRHMYMNAIDLLRGDKKNQVEILRSVPSPLECRRIASPDRGQASFPNNKNDNNNNNTANPRWSTTLCMVETARSAGQERIKRDVKGGINETDCRERDIKGYWDLNLGDTLQCMSQQNVFRKGDIVVVNTGLHHQTAATLEENTRDFIAWAKTINKTKDGICVTWRQTLPQHFPTPTGGWESSLMHNAIPAFNQARQNSTSCCVPLQTTTASSSSSSVVLQGKNSISDPLLTAAKIPTIRMWESMVALWKYHKDCRIDHVKDCTKGACTKISVDCSHWTPPVVTLSTKLLLDQIQQICL